MQVRLALIMDQYDNLALKRNELDNMPLDYPELQQQIFELDEKIKSLISKMNYYKISLDKMKRKPLAEYAKQHETTFEKLTRINGRQMPILANISRSTARTLITMFDLGVFTDKDGRFNFHEAQMFANCVMAFYIEGGHHSLTEVAEIYNRLVDYVLLHTDELEKLGLVGCASDRLYFNDPDMIEQKMPYYFIGSYRSFLHESYADRVLAIITTDVENKVICEQRNYQI